MDASVPERAYDIPVSHNAHPSEGQTRYHLHFLLRVPQPAVLSPNQESGMQMQILPRISPENTVSLFPSADKEAEARRLRSGRPKDVRLPDQFLPRSVLRVLQKRTEYDFRILRSGQGIPPFAGGSWKVSGSGYQHY